MVSIITVNVLKEASITLRKFETNLDPLREKIVENNDLLGNAER